MVTTILSSAELPLDENAKKILAYAIEEADRLGDSYISPGHLVLAILRVPESRAAGLLHEPIAEYDMVSEVVRFIHQTMRQREKEKPSVVR